MQQLPKEFSDWYDSLNIVKQNNGPAKGTIATALVVLQRLQEDFNLDSKAHVAAGGMQIKGASGSAIAGILKSFGEERPFAKEGGRTNRGGPAEVKALLEALAKLKLSELPESERNKSLRAMQAFLVERVKEYHNRQKLKFTFDPSLSTWILIHNLLETAADEGKAGYVAQHLVGAKLQLRFPNINVSNESASTADMQTNRPGDFLIGETAFHVTVSPMPSVYEKCKHNISQGLKPFLLVPDNKLMGARQTAESFCGNHVAVESLESFVSQNIEEISTFHKDQLVVCMKDLIELYNKRVDGVETDKSLMIELPSNLV